MRQLPKHSFLIVLLVAAGILFVLTGLIGGPGLAFDVSAIQTLDEARKAHVGLTSPAVIITHAGNAEALIPILALAVVLLTVARRFRDAAALAGIVLGGRIAVELLKLAIYRPRPFFTPYPVDVSSMSFPSGHAGNSMTTFLAMALIAAPTRWRPAAIAGAILASVTIGLTRPLLGVHWPTDVVGGWTFGIVWVSVLVGLTARWRDAAK